MTRVDRSVYLDAQRLAEQLLGDTTAANVLALGACWQTGVLPISLGSLEQAIRLNGVAIEQNLAALAWGRAWVADADAVLAAVERTPAPARLSHSGTKSCSTGRLPTRESCGGCSTFGCPTCASGGMCGSLPDWPIRSRGYA